ncbi:hypothetical protein UFOVP352_39 [uncultured Caudovirales phage]|uniref:Uncharacterized protein n=1 Tax=uncultured Caudovirales phage TaxID=2100421 RepID=A0A6J5M2V6_9CAUD|nr:hypothetical protein UFOVP352_39 [uncultured Caudovirales phage]CAB4218483.1 hypothetical protein UFOVP1607_23 [uncultured Caudovirales phage]
MQLQFAISFCQLATIFANWQLSKTGVSNKPKRRPKKIKNQAHIILKTNSQYVIIKLFPIGGF